eukprot:gene5593-9408_t
MSLGQEIDPGCLVKFEEMKKGNYDFVAYGMDSSEENIIVTDCGKKNDLIQSLPSNDCRYISYHLKNNDKSTVIFINWAPDTAKIKKKLTYRASKSILLEKIHIDEEISASELEEVEAVFKK